MKRLFVISALGFALHASAEDWPQFMFNSAHSGNAAEIELDVEKLGLQGAVAMTDGIYTSPVVAGGKVYVVDGSGVAACFDAATLKQVWRFQSKGGKQNVNNVSSPAIVGKYLHFGTTAGIYYVLDRETGKVVKEIDCHEPIFSTPVIGNDRVYFATLGAQAYAITNEGEVKWTWDFVKEVVGFDGNRWSGESWAAFCEKRMLATLKPGTKPTSSDGRVTWRDHFVCSRDICLIKGNVVVMPAGGRTIFLEDTGIAPKLKATGEIPEWSGKEFPATFGQSADDDGNVYVQWHRRDNAGRVDIMRLEGDTLTTGDFVPGTDTNIRMDGLLSFSPVAIRGSDVFRVKPETNRGLIQHNMSTKEQKTLSGAGAIAPPVLTKKHVIFGGLDGRVYLVPIDGGKVVQPHRITSGAITAPVAVADGCIFVASEDGSLSKFASVQVPPPPFNYISSEMTEMRSPLTGKLADAKYDWYTNYGNFAGQNSNNQDLKPPLRMRWARRLEGTVKHLPVCGGGRMYTHTAEGQIIACEQDTGRLLWRKWWPDVYLSFTSPLYIDGKLLVPQAGIKKSFVRCLDAATGNMLWEAPFTGSPSWSRQFPPVVAGNVAIYASGSGDYATQGSEKPWTFGGTPVVPADGKEVMSFIYSNDNPYYPKNHHPRLWAWDLDTGKVVWEKDFVDQGRGGNDCGICILDGKLYYSVFFGYDSETKMRRGLPVDHNGLTCCIDPRTGKILWQTNDYYVTAKCTLSARDGKLYIGGYNKANAGTEDRFVWCLDANTGKLVWKSDAVTSALNVVSVGEKFMFCNALRGKGNIFDASTGNVTYSILTNYACCRFTMSEPYVLGANMDMIDLSQEGKLVSTGPAIDSRECLGAVVSNGRIFYTSQASGFIVSQTYGPESKNLPPAWEVRETK
ncbi:PQQ-binding-like beta-propeller repeat protein [Prosthecobacter sp.]|uniref:outer membrane protein assembly factor BamB family protein n=1 Tax=Prosthecobacter sp. TaxID=1965333 RepID=UPI001D616A56|nr:PQQ-binding-like beta-propeller repeat protein [Prosthecobacter sp.]MCB1276364.1 PQQ-binding-like beta-propeller repeat protein [Prosthecobacter sp.]